MINAKSNIVIVKHQVHTADKKSPMLQLKDVFNSRYLRKLQFSIYLSNTEITKNLTS